MNPIILLLFCILDGIYGLFIGLGMQQFSFGITGLNYDFAARWFIILCLAMLADGFGKIVFPFIKERFSFIQKKKLVNKCIYYKSRNPDFNIETAMNQNIDGFISFNLSIYENLISSIVSVSLTTGYFIYTGKAYYAVFTLFIVVAAYFINNTSNKKIAKYGKESYISNNELLAFEANISKNINDLFNISSLSNVINKHIFLLKDFREKSEKKNVLNSLLELFRKELLPFILKFSVFIFVLFTKNDNDTIIDLVAYLYLFHRFLNPSNNILDFIQKYQSNKALLKDFKTISKDYMINKKEINKQFNKNYSNIDFVIPGKKLLLGKNIVNTKEIKIDKPGVYRITGENGTGKSQFLNSCDGNYGYMPQNTVIYNLSILQNILLKITCSNEDLNIKDADLDILSLLKKTDYNDVIENEGLSLGQKQLIGFLRLVQQNAYVNILDECENGLDEINLTKVKNYILKNKEKKAFIIVSHSNVFDDLVDMEIKIDEIIQ